MSDPASEVEFEPGWLERQMKDCRVSIAEKYGPDYVIRYFHGKVTLPLDPDEAVELYGRMNRRFEQWTGRSLKEFER